MASSGSTAGVVSPGRVPSSQAARLLRQIAERKAAEAEAIAATMRSIYADEIPAYRRITDPALLEETKRVHRCFEARQRFPRGKRGGGMHVAECVQSVDWSPRP